MDGTFNFGADGLIEVVAAPGWSRAAIKQVQQALAAAEYQLRRPGADELAVLTETTRRFDHAKPGLGAQLKNAFNADTSPSLTIWLSALQPVLALIAALILAGQQAPDETEIRRVVEDELQRLRYSGEPGKAIDSETQEDFLPNEAEPDGGEIVPGKRIKADDERA